MNVCEGDNAYFYNERASLSILAAAIWKSNGIAIEEYTSMKRYENENFNGRVDLWFQVENYYCLVESKQLFKRTVKNNIHTIPENIKFKMDQSIEDAKESMHEEKNGFAIVFFSPSYFELQDYRGAIVDYNKAIELDPEFIDAYYNRGCSKHKLQDYIGAIEDLTKVIELDSAVNIAYYGRGLSKYLLHEYTEAIADFNKAIDLNPYEKKAYYFRGLSKQKLLDNRGAITDYNQTIELDSDFINAYKSRGICKFELKDYRGAVIDFNKVIELDPNNKEAYKHRGTSKYMLEEINEACLDWSKAGELGDVAAYDVIKELCN